jgi:Zn-dependent protease with chaperone function
MRITSYRYPGERAILFVTILVVLTVIALTATATVCTSVLFMIGFFVISMSFSASHHRELMRAAAPVTTQRMPELNKLVKRGVARLQPGEIEAYVLPSPQLNAYTFGLDRPKVVVIYSSLVEVMDEDELMFVVGHELGHVALGHTWLNSLVGGMAGIPASWSAGALLSVTFLWWNRACEYSADRAGLLACGRLDKAISALVRLGAGRRPTSKEELDQVYRQLDAQDDNLWGALDEALASHPLLIKRINELRRYASTSAYRRLQEGINRM